MKSKELQSTPYGFIDASRTIRKLFEVCVPKDGIQTGPFGSQLHSSDYVADGTPIITVEHLGENIIEGKKPPLVSAEDVKRLIKYTLKEGDIVFSRVGSVDRRALVSKAQNGWMFSGRLLRVRPEPLLADPRYLSYFFGLPMFKTYIRSIAVGATMPSLNTGLLSEIPIILPSISEQRAISNVLSALDEKIRINSALSKTLEDIAQTIFKSWFIDFDPAKAKMAGAKPAGMDSATASLFPDSMEESELGIKPKEWKILEITELGKVVTGKTPSTTVAEYWGEDIPFVTIPDMHGTIVNTVTKRRLTVAGAESQKNQMLSRGSAMVSCIATPGLVVYATGSCQTNQQINSVIPKNLEISSWLYWHIRSLTSSVLLHSGVGTIFANLNKGDFGRIKSVVPPETLQLSSSQIFEPLLSQIESLSRENLILADIRDNLLPRLISGELQIPEEMLAS